MEYLKEHGFTEQDIKDIIDNNFESIIENLKLNKDKVQTIVDYLTGIGI